MTNYSQSVLKSNGLRHSKNLPEKLGFSPIDTPANTAKKLPSQRCFKPLFIASFNFSHKRLTFAFTDESGYTLGFAQRIAHNGPHAETGAFQLGVLSLTLGAFRTFTNIPGPGFKTANFAVFGSRPGVLPQASRPRWATLPVAAAHSARFSGIERLDQAFWQSYYHTQ